MSFKQFFFIKSQLTHALPLSTYALICGIIAYFYPGIVISLPVLLATLYAINKIDYYILCSMTLLFLGGYMRTFVLSHKHTKARSSIQSQSHNLTLCVTNIEQTDRAYLRWLVEATINDTNKNNKDVLNYTVRIYTSVKPQCCVGDSLYIENLKQTSKDNKSFLQYMTRNNLIATYFIPRLEYTLISRPSWSVQRSLHNLKHQLIYKIRKKMSYETYQLFCSLFLGKKIKHTEIKQHHKQWGTSHYLARSGLHMMIFIMLWKILISLLPLSFGWQHFLLSLLALIYTLLSWGSISFMRALFIFILLQVANILEQKTNAFFVITLITLIALFINPFHILFIDFQLSFGLTIALALSNILLSHKKQYDTLQTLAKEKTNPV